MTDGILLLAAIIAQPDDDTVRLVYADWLEESGDTERATRVRVETVWREQLNTRTKVGRGWSRYAAELVGDAVPKSWVVWPVEYPPAVTHLDGESPHSWEFQCGICSFSSSRPYLVVGMRYGFVEAVAAPANRLVKALPALVRRQPVRRVAVTGLFLEYEHFVRDVGFDGDRVSRVIRRDTNRIPADVFALLTPEPWESYGQQLTCTYPNLTAAFEDLGRAFLAWARSCPIA